MAEALRAGNPLERILIAQGAGGPRLQEIIDLARRAACRCASSRDRRWTGWRALRASGRGRAGRGAQICRPGPWRRAKCWWCWTAWKIRTIWALSFARRMRRAPVRSSSRSGARPASRTWWRRRRRARWSILPVVRVANINRALEDLKQRGFWIYGLDERGTEAYDQIDYAAKSRRCSRIGLSETAPASIHASTTAASCSGESDMPGEHRCDQDAARHAGGVQLATASTRRGWGVPGSLARHTSSSSVPIERLQFMSPAARGLGEQVEVAQDHRGLGQDRERVPGRSSTPRRGPA